MTTATGQTRLSSLVETLLSIAIGFDEGHAVTIEPPRDGDTPTTCPICLMPLMPDGECVRHDRDEMILWGLHFRLESEEMERRWDTARNATIAQCKMTAQVEAERDAIAAKLAEAEKHLSEANDHRQHPRASRAETKGRRQRRVCSRATNAT